MIVRRHITTEFISKSFAIRVVDDWNNLPEEVVAVGPVR